MGKIVTICASNNSMHTLYDIETIILESGYTPLIPASSRGSFTKTKYLLEAQKDKVRVADIVVVIPGKDGTYDEITQEAINYAADLNIKVIDHKQFEQHLIDAIKAGCNEAGIKFGFDSHEHPYVVNKNGRKHGAMTIEDLYQTVNTLYVELKLNLFGENDEQEK